MKTYEPIVFDHLILLVRDEDENARQWLRENGFPELTEFWDAVEGVEKSFRWLLENKQRPLAALVDAMNGDDKAKMFLITSGHRELAAFVDACDGKAGAVSWLVNTGQKGWLRLAQVIAAKEKKKEKNFFWNLLNLGNPFR